MDIPCLKSKVSSQLIKSLPDIFPEGCWIYDADFNKLHTLHSPFSFGRNQSEFLRRKLTETAKQSISMLLEFSMNLNGGITFYACPFRDHATSSRYALCTYTIQNDNYFLNSTLGRTARRAAEFVRGITAAPEMADHGH